MDIDPPPPRQQQQQQQQAEPLSNALPFGARPYTPAEHARLSFLLQQKMPPENISQRASGTGQRVPYIEGWRAIDIANAIFGFNGWATQVVSQSVDFAEDAGGGRWSVGILCTVRVTLQDGTYREDTGYGLYENARSRGQALEKARKEATTDALKRTLRLFGNSLGNCLGNKDYTDRARAMPKLGPKPIQEHEVYRNPDTAPMAAVAIAAMSKAPPGAAGSEYGGQQQQGQQPVGRAQTMPPPTSRPGNPTRLTNPPPQYAPHNYPPIHHHQGSNSISSSSSSSNNHVQESKPQISHPPLPPPPPRDTAPPSVAQQEPPPVSRASNGVPVYHAAGATDPASGVRSFGNSNISNAPPGQQHYPQPPHQGTDPPPPAYFGPPMHQQPPSHNGPGMPPHHHLHQQQHHHLPSNHPKRPAAGPPQILEDQNKRPHN